MLGSYFHTPESMPSPSVTPYERCRVLLVDLRLAQRRLTRDIDYETSLRWQIGAFPIKTISAAFDSIVDECGWNPVDPVAVA